MHIAFALDTTQSTASERARLFVNGSRVTAFSTATYPSQNSDLLVGDTNLHLLGRISGFSYDFDGYLADLHFCDGTAYDASAFGEFSATTGVWMPKQFTGSYGTNGFKLDFADNSAATAAALGKDTSGNGNNWTPTNLSITAGAGNDSLIDVPVNGSQTDTGVGGEVRGNYATLNPLDNGGITLTNGNLDWARPSAGTRVCYSTIGVSSGKWYFESSIVGATSGVNWECGVATTSTSNAARPGTTATGWQVQTSGSTTILKQNNNTTTTIFTGTISSGDIFSVALDMDNGRIWFGRNGTWLEGNPAAGTGASFTNLSGTVEAFAGGDGSVSGSINFGQRPFAYTAPSGFKALCTANLPAPTIVKPSTVMDVVTYTGTGSTLTPTSSLGFSPDLVWIKSRSAATDNTLYDVVRGAQARLESNTTDAEVTSDNGLTAFNSAGFTLGTLAQVNTSSATYAAWTWDAGSSTVTNTQGSISSQVRANASAGFSVVTWTGNNTAGATIGHGLNAIPQFIVTFKRGGGREHAVWHGGLSSSGTLYLANTYAAATYPNRFDVTGFTSSVFKIGSDPNTVNESDNYVAYCWAPLAGYSSFGSYTGNGSTDGPFVYTGFRPRWVMVKETTTGAATSHWVIKDSSRPNYNATSGNLYANLSNAEDSISTVDIDITSNGFKIRGTYGGINTNNSTHVYAAFAESPFQYSRAR
jgi:hypothetical protein